MLLAFAAAAGAGAAATGGGLGLAEVALGPGLVGGVPFTDGDPAAIPLAAGLAAPGCLEAIALAGLPAAADGGVAGARPEEAAATGDLLPLGAAGLALPAAMRSAL